MPQKAPKTVLSVNMLRWPIRLCRVFWNSVQKNQNKHFGQAKMCASCLPWKSTHKELLSLPSYRWQGLCVCVCALSHVQLFVTPWTVACQAPLSIDSSRQGYWSGFPFPAPGGLPEPGIELASPALADRFFIIAPPGKPIFILFLFESPCLLRTYAICLGTRYYDIVPFRKTLIVK